jgi:hypothetical protein
MADFISDGMTRVAYVAAIANALAPTTTELNLGLLLQSIITGDGLVGFEVSTTAVDNTALNSTFDTNLPGRDSYSNPKFTLKKQTGTDTVFATLVKNAIGFIVVRRDIAETTAWASTQPLEVYPAMFGQRRRVTPAGNVLTKWETDIFFYSAPSLTAAVA